MTNAPVAPLVSVQPDVAPQSTIGGGAEVTDLVPTIAALTQAIAGLTQVLAAMVPTPGTAPAAAAAPAFGAAAAPAAASPMQPGKRGGKQDGPGVFRNIVPTSKLEQDPKLRGKLDPPSGGTPPKGVKVHTRADGARVVTLNIHGAVPGGKALTRGNENIAGLRDVARYINSINPDVVMMQEVNDRPFDPKQPGVTAMTSVLAHLMNASDMAYTPGQGAHGPRHDAVTYTRNGYTIPKAMNVDLPDKGDPARRSAGVMVVQPPDDRPAFTVMSTHLSHMPNVAASGRRRNQMLELDRVANQIRQTGSFTYSDPGGGQHTATGFPQDRIMVGGDLNTSRGGRNGGIDSADRLFANAGLRHAADLSGHPKQHAGIDHIYARGFRGHLSVVAQVGAHELRAGKPTDHPGYITDLS